MRYHHVLILVTALLLALAGGLVIAPTEAEGVSCGSAFKPNDEAVLADVLKKFSESDEAIENRRYFGDVGKGLSGEAVEQCKDRRELVKVTALLVAVFAVMFGPLGWLNRERFTRRRKPGRM